MMMATTLMWEVFGRSWSGLSRATHAKVEIAATAHDIRPIRGYQYF